jgi:hypothetical protein
MTDLDAHKMKCPACGTSIRRELIAAGDDTPQPNRIYRCAVCRLELIVSEDGQRMIVAPLEHRPPPAHQK